MFKLLENRMQKGKKFYVYGLGIILLLALAVRFAGPVKDGDFFWHVEYGKYMVEHKTLVPDHAIYSWTPADNSATKCNWIADIALYLMDQAGGLPLLFAFRYLCIFFVVSIVWIYARHTEQGNNLFTFLVLIIVLITSYGGPILKPEIFSMIFMGICAGLYFWIKSSAKDQCNAKFFLLYPFIFLLWINIHEVFIFGLIILGLITLGEITNYSISKKCAFNLTELRYLIAGSMLSLVSTIITPYGFVFYLKLYHGLKTAHNDLCVKTVISYKTIFHPSLSNLHYVEFWLVMVITFIFLFALSAYQKKEWDWGILLPNLFLAIIFAVYVRATYYWPVFWGMSLFFLQKKNSSFWKDCLNKIKPVYLKMFNFGIAALFLFYSIRTIYDAKYTQITYDWCGFGISYANPVQASAFLKQYQPGNFLYNSYNVGGYLIYDLYPLYKVFIDPRYFPYKSWYADYHEFNYGQTSIEKFQEKYPIDVAVVDYISSKSAIIKFLRSSEWQPVFYGPAAIIFTKKDIDFQYNILGADKHRFDNLSNLQQAYEVFMMAQSLGDLETSKYIIKIINKKFFYLRDYHKTINLCNLYLDGMNAYAAGDYENALTKLNSDYIRYFAVRTNSALKNLWTWKVKLFIPQGKYDQAFSILKLKLRYYPEDINEWYNAGVLGFMIDRKERLSTDPQKKTDWPQYLKYFVKLAPNHPQADVAKQILEKKEFSGAIPFILTNHADF